MQFKAELLSMSANLQAGQRSIALNPVHSLYDWIAPFPPFFLHVAMPDVHIVNLSYSVTCLRACSAIVRLLSASFLLLMSTMSSTHSCDCLKLLLMLLLAACKQQCMRVGCETRCRSQRRSCRQP